MNLELFPEADKKPGGEMIAEVDFDQMVQDAELLRATGIPGSAAIDRVLTDIHGITEQETKDLREKMVDAMLTRVVKKLSQGNPHKRKPGEIESTRDKQIPRGDRN